MDVKIIKFVILKLRSLICEKKIWPHGREVIFAKPSENLAIQWLRNNIWPRSSMDRTSVS